MSRTNYGYLLIILALILLLTACGPGPKSGNRYEKDILNTLSPRYNLQFKVVERTGVTNKDGYEKLILSPINDPNIKFFASSIYAKSYYSIFRSEQHQESYLDGLFFAYAPSLYARHLNFKFPSDYFSETLKYGEIYKSTYERDGTAPYIIDGVTEKDFIPLSKDFYEIIKGFYPHRPPSPNLVNQLGSTIELPYRFEGSTKLQLIRHNFASAEPYDSYEIYRQFVSSYEQMKEGNE
ncbi:hypothetical protein NST58_04360 [Paenibacillus sp. FSL R10-2796]|uniref:hypothetical protein n=1 Tax=Paenibacillus TaxID=44249 RepID=UPI0020BF8877|nr:hypothetical protein [Paenibacillus odorifer]